MTDPAISETYRKDALHSAGHGYGRNMGSAIRPEWTAYRGQRVGSVIVHSTNNSQKGTKIWNECTFIRDSPDVSCHDVIGKDGTIYVILPADMVAWHAGNVLVQWGNLRSYGIELHISVGEQPTPAQFDSLTWRVRQLIQQHTLTKGMIETHRAVALPAGRKSDPEGWSNVDFYEWRSRLFLPVEPDWQEEWGYAVPYHKEWGIPQAYRDSYRKGTPLGKAISGEMAAAAKLVVQAFERGYITWHPTGGTKVSDW